MIAMLAALEEEIKGLRKRMSVTRRLEHQGCWVWEGTFQGKEVLLARTGVGRRRSQAGATFVTGSYHPGAMISFGFAAGITPELKGGDVVVCSAVYRGDSESKETISCDATLLDATLKVQRKNIRVVKGAGVTVSRVLATKADKNAFAAALPAKIADMESYWVGQIAAEKGIPFLAARAVSDTVDDALPHLERLMDASGSWKKRKVLFYFLARPREAGRLAKLSVGVRRARQNLDRFMEGFLTGLAR